MIVGLDAPHRPNYATLDLCNPIGKNELNLQSRSWSTPFCRSRTNRQEKKKKIYVWYFAIKTKERGKRKYFEGQLGHTEVRSRGLSVWDVAKIGEEKSRQTVNA